MKRSALVAIARGMALFLGGFSLLNVVGDLRTPGFDANLWWIDFRPLPVTASRLFLVAVSGLLLAFALKPATGRARRKLLRGAVGLTLAVTTWNAVHFYVLFAGHKLSGGFPLPFSFLVTAGLVVVLSGIPSEPVASRRRIMALTVALCMVGFPLAQIYCFGKTDYRRPADAVVVFGARAFRNGHCSRALRDRVRTGCQLYLDGLAHTLIFSGGPGDGATTEPEAMRRFAIGLGVPDRDILLDPKGLDTEATAKNTCPLFVQHNFRRVMAVSHFYHLPRIKMTYRRHGWNVYTVPAQESQRLVRMPYYMMREVVALWVYYLRPLVRR